jgi:hypothetical protein
VHPTEQLRPTPWGSRPLTLQDFLPLAPDLDAHVFDTRLMKSSPSHPVSILVDEKHAAPAGVVLAVTSGPRKRAPRRTP